MKIIPVESIALLLGVDRFMSEARAIVNLIGNGVATVVIAKSEQAFDAEQNRRALEGHVVSVAPSSTATSGAISYYVTVGLDQTDSKLRDGQTARGTVHTLEKDNVLSVSNAAVHRQGSTTTVVLLTADGSQQTAPFEAGVVGSDRTEVLSGLTEGQRVVLPSGAS